MKRKYFGFEVLTAIIMNSIIFWDVMKCSSVFHRSFGGTYSPVLKVEE
jgi:hypothetical protein